MESFSLQSGSSVVCFCEVTTSFEGLKTRVLTVHIYGQVGAVLKSIGTFSFPGSLLSIVIVNFPEKSNSFLVVASDSLSSFTHDLITSCLLYTSPSPRDATLSRMPSSA